MSEYKSKKFPYKQLGAQLKSMRIKRQESIAEVSGAVEIDDSYLSDIEEGIKRPSEDILMLIISYFSLKDDEAVKLWELAGYNRSESQNPPRIKRDESIQQVLVMPLDARIVFTDIANISTNKYGVTISFLQSEGPNGQPLAVSRVGMSREHAEKLLQTLGKALNPVPPKLLPAPESKENPDNKKQ